MSHPTPPPEDPYGYANPGGTGSGSAPRAWDHQQLTPPGGYPMVAPPSQPYGTPPQPSQPFPHQPPGQQFPYPGSPAGQPAGSYPGQTPFGYGSAPWQGFSPGIVALRPLQLGDFFSGATGLVRYNPKATLGLSLLVHLFIAATAGLGLAWWLPQISSLNTTADVSGGTVLRTLGPALATIALQLLASALLGIMLPFVTIEAVVGRKVSISETWQAIKFRILPSIGYQLLLGIAALVLVGLTLGYPIYLGVKGHTSGAFGMGALGTMVLSVALLFLQIRLAFVTCAIVLERAPIRDAVLRSWRLTAGQFWRIFGITILVSLVVAVLQQAITLPLSVLAGTLGGVSSGQTSSVTAAVLPLLGVEIAQVIAVPFTVAVTALLYVDQRIRREGFDIALLQSAQAPRPVQNTAH